MNNNYDSKKNHNLKKNHGLQFRVSRFYAKYSHNKENCLSIWNK